tara:strand:+ start:242 stop:517 length:276 start_codon:yes stop_codon:yes gene_type:complete
MKILAGSVEHTEVNTTRKTISGGAASRKVWTIKVANFKSTSAWKMKKMKTWKKSIKLSRKNSKTKDVNVVEKLDTILIIVQEILILKHLKT